MASIKTIQVTKINNVPFNFASPFTVDYPVAPSISAKLFNNSEGKLILKIRATLYIDSANTAIPSVESNPVVKGGSLHLYFDYNFSEERPKSLDVWYIELDYISSKVGYITGIKSFLRDLDPETSRGTETGVGH